MSSKLSQIVRNIIFAGKLAGWRQALAAIVIGNIVNKEGINKNVAGKTAIVIAPHPDDEIMGCGGALSLWRKYGGKISVHYIFDGTRGTSNGSRDYDLKKIRKQEAQKGLKIIGGGDQIFYNIEDGSTNCIKSKEIIVSIINKIKLSKSCALFIPWFGEENLDHKATYRIAKNIIRTAIRMKFHNKIQIWLYEVWTPLVPNQIVCIDDVVELKKRAISAHQSQLKSTDYLSAALGLNAYRGVINAKNGKYAEAFMVMSAYRLFKIEQQR